MVNNVHHSGRYLGYLIVTDNILSIQANISFGGNTAALQGDSVYAEDISRCTSIPCYNKESNSASSTYNNSFFSLPNLFQYETANSTLPLDR